MGEESKGCAVLSERIWKNIAGYGWKGVVIALVKCKITSRKYTYILM